jgi:predicted thioesterase
MEWVGRLFVLEMLEAGEEGIGTTLHVEHHAPAFAGETVEFRATFAALENGELICAVEVRVGKRLVATGRTGQRIVSCEKLAARFAALRSSNPTSA